MPANSLAVAGLMFLTSAALLAQDSRSLSQTHQRRDPQTLSVVFGGRVLNEAGQPPDEVVQVDLVCNGRIRQQTVTASDGSFFFEIGSPRTEDWLDPGIGGSVDGSLESTVKVAKPGRVTKLDEVPSMGLGRASLSGCEVRASPRPGVTSNAIRLNSRGAFEDPDIGVIVIRRLSDSGATTASVNLLSAPDKARRAFEKANEELAAPNPNLAKATRELEKALRDYPQFSAAWDLLARVQLSQGRYQEGQQSFLRAIKEEPKFIPPYLGMAQIAVRASNWKDAGQWTGKVLELDPGQPQALYWNGLADYYLSRFEQAEKSFSRLYQLGYATEYPFGLLPLGVIHANQGKIQAAATEFRMYLDHMPPDQITEAQKLELEKQLAQWKSEGIEPVSSAHVPGLKTP